MTTDNSKNIYISLVILASMVTVRVLMRSFNDDKVIMLFMSMINVVALSVVIILILFKAYSKMEETQAESEKRMKGKIVVNSEMNLFRIISFLISILIIIVSIVYLVYFQSCLWNDIFTIMALVLSINDDAFINKIFKLCYKSYHGNKIKKYLDSIKET